MATRSPPTHSTAAAPAASKAARTRCAMGTPSTGTSALSRPMRRDAPPASTAALKGSVSITGPIVRASPGGGDSRRIALEHEEVAALGLVGLADSGRRGGQAPQRPQEAAVGFVIPPHVATAPPAVGPQTVEPPVV